MDPFKKFATFIKNNRLEAYVRIYVDYVYQLDVPLLKFFKHLTEEQIIELNIVSVGQFLTSLENDTVFQEAQTNLENWENDQIPGISKNDVQLSDIILIYSAHKTALFNFLPDYTDDVRIATELIFSVEKFYRKVQEMASNMLLKIQKQEDDKKRELEARYAVLFDNSSDLVYMASPTGELLHTNEALQKTLGYTAGELKDMRISDLLWEGEEEALKKALEILFESKDKGSVEIDIVFKNKHGYKVYLEGLLGAMYKGGNLQYTQGILRDVSERIAYETELQEINKKILHLIKNAPDGIAVYTRKENIMLWNPECAHIFGWTESEIQDTNITKILPGLKKFDAWEFIGTPLELTGIRKNGEAFPVSLIVSESEQNGQPVYIAFIRDITEEKRRVEELEKRRILLEKYNLQLEQYTRLSSHDLKEPVRKILMQSDLLLSRNIADLIPEARERVLKIHASATRMTNLIEGILAFSSISEKKEHFRLVNLDLLVDNVISDLEPIIEEKHAIIKHDKLPEIEANPVQIAQLFENIIHNALKYSKPNETPQVIISSVGGNPELVCIAIQDNGIGFNNEYAEKVFDIFERLNNANVEGTGIGLALCRKITEIHKGTIKAHSEKGQGSVFEITLPRKQFTTPT